MIHVLQSEFLANQTNSRLLRASLLLWIWWLGVRNSIGFLKNQLYQNYSVYQIMQKSNFLQSKIYYGFHVHCNNSSNRYNISSTTYANKYYNRVLNFRQVQLILCNSMLWSACLKINFAKVFNKLLQQITRAHLLWQLRQNFRRSFFSAAAIQRCLYCCQRSRHIFRSLNRPAMPRGIPFEFRSTDGTV